MTADIEKKSRNGFRYHCQLCQTDREGWTGSGLREHWNSIQVISRCRRARAICPKWLRVTSSIRNEWWRRRWNRNRCPPRSVIQFPRKLNAEVAADAARSNNGFASDESHSGRRQIPDTYAQLVVVNWTSPVSICPHTGDGRLSTPVPHPGTCCLTISRTLISPFKLSNVILRHSSFPHTSTFSAFEVSYQMRYINSLLLLLLLSQCSTLLLTGFEPASAPHALSDRSRGPSYHNFRL